MGIKKAKRPLDQHVPISPEIINSFSKKKYTDQPYYYCWNVLQAGLMGRSYTQGLPWCTVEVSCMYCSVYSLDGYSTW